jgi:hypothetical protein
LKHKILIFSHYPFYPLDSGGAIAQYYFIEHLRVDIDIHFIYPVYTKKNLVDFRRVKKEFPNVIFHEFRFEIINEKVSILTKFKKYIFSKKKVYFTVDDFANLGHLITNYFYSEAFINFFVNIIYDHNISIVQLEFFKTLSLVNAIPKSVKKIFICHELRYKRLYGAQKFSNFNYLYTNFVIENIKKYELQIMKEFDTLVVFCEEDKIELASNGLVSNISSFSIPPNLIYKSEEHNFKGFVFFGSEFHGPNKEGLSWLLDDTFINFLSERCLAIRVLGFWSIEFKSRYKSKYIIFEGFVENINSFLAGYINIVPIFSGSGIRTKVLFSLSNSQIVISTKLGIEGIPSKIEEEEVIPIFNETSELVNKISLIIDSDLFFVYSNRSKKLFDLYFSNNLIIKKRLEIYDL